MLEFFHAKIVLELWQALLFVPGFAFLAHGLLQILETKQEGVAQLRPSPPKPKNRVLAAKTPVSRKTERAGPSTSSFERTLDVAQALPVLNNVSYTHAPENFVPPLQVAAPPQSVSESGKKPPWTEQQLDFLHGLSNLNLPARPRQALKHWIEGHLTRADFRMLTPEGKELSFDEWCHQILREESYQTWSYRDEIRNFGEKSFEQLKVSIETYLAGPEANKIPLPPDRWAEHFNEHIDLLPLKQAAKWRLKRAVSQTPERFYALEQRWPRFDEWCDLVLAGKLKPREDDENGLHQVGKQTIEQLKTAIKAYHLTRWS